jgi:hypothetical protein
MMVAARYSDQPPAIRLNHFDDLGTVHIALLGSYTRLHNLASG